MESGTEHKGRILLVDDESAILRTFRYCLEDEGYSVATANSANQALDRVINFFPEERRTQLLMDLSLNLKAMISQRLIPKQDGKGRQAAVEIMLNSPLISDLIFKGEVSEIKEIMKKSRNLGMQTFDQSLAKLYEQGKVDMRGAMTAASNPHDLKVMLQQRGLVASTSR